MADKTLKTRILMKIDTLENWNTSTLPLKKGEIAIATIAATAGTGLTEPVTMMKIGSDGVKTFKELDWAFYAKASDVLNACKSTEGLTAFVNNVIKNAGIATSEALTAVQNDVNSLKTLVGDVAVATQISDAIAALKLSDNYDAKGSAEAVKNALLGDAATEYNTLGKLEDAVIAAQASANEKTTMAEVEAKDYATKTEAQGYATAVVGVAADTADKDTVKGAKKYADSLNTAMDTRVDALETAIGAGGSVATQISTEIGKLNADEVAVGQGEIIEKISESAGKISVSKRALVAADIPTITQSQVDGLAGALAGKQDNLAFEGAYDKESNKVTTKSYVDSVVAGLNGAMHFKGAVTGDTFEEAIAGKTYEAGDVVLYGVEERVYDGTEWHILGNESIYQLKEDAATDKQALQGAIALKQDILGFDGAYNKESNKVATVSTVETAINNLNADKLTVGTGEIIDSIVEQGGKITATKRALVAADIPALEISKITGLQTELDKIDNLQESLKFDGTYDPESNKVATVSTVDNAVSNFKIGLKNTDAAVKHQFVTEVKQENGIVSVLRAIITTDDLAQGTNELIFDCGNSTAN